MQPRETGRDQQPSGLSEDFFKWVNDNYNLKRQKGFVRIDDKYRKIKNLMLKREPYNYKMELLEYDNRE